MSLCRRILLFSLMLTLMPCDAYALALTSSDPLFVCAGHRCACRTRLTCLKQCCCFPKKAKNPLPANSSALKGCGGAEELISLPFHPEAAGSVESWIAIGEVIPFVVIVQHVFSELSYDVLTPPPRLIA